MHLHDLPDTLPQTHLPNRQIGSCQFFGRRFFSDSVSLLLLKFNSLERHIGLITVGFPFVSSASSFDSGLRVPPNQASGSTYLYLWSLMLLKGLLAFVYGILFPRNIFQWLPHKVRHLLFSWLRSWGSKVEDRGAVSASSCPHRKPDTPSWIIKEVTEASLQSSAMILILPPYS